MLLAEKIILGIFIVLFYQGPLLSASIKVLAEDVPTTRSMRELSLRKNSEANPTTIQFELMPYEAMIEKADLDLFGGSGIYDLILQYNTALASYISHNVVISLAELKAKFPNQLVKGFFPFEVDLFQNCWKEVGWYQDAAGVDIEAYAIPFTANTMILAYNKELFSNETYKRQYWDIYNVDLASPKTWQEFKRIVAFFHRPDQKIYGICLQGAPYFIYHEWANFAYSFGGGLMKKRWGWEDSKAVQCILNAPETIQATQFYVELKKYDASNDFYKTDAMTQVEVLKEKNCALALIWSDVAYSLAYENGEISEKYDFAPIPGPVSMLAGGSFYINRQGKNVESVMKFVLDQMQKETQVILMKNGLCSPLRSIYDFEEIQKIPYANALKTSLEKGIYMLEAGHNSDHIIRNMSKILQNLVMNSKNGTIDPQTIEIAFQDHDLLQYLKSQ
jgi:ABC-type glycerol-3-phosphate transport system substrate-binding protein